MIVGEALRGWLDVCEGSPRGIEKILRSVARSRTDGETLHLTYTLLLLAGSCHGRRVRPGRAVAREGLSWSHRHNQRYLEAELWRVDGELAHRGGETEAAPFTAVPSRRQRARGGLVELRGPSTPWPVDFRSDRA